MDTCGRAARVMVASDLRASPRAFMTTPPQKLLRIKDTAGTLHSVELLERFTMDIDGRRFEFGIHNTPTLRHAVTDIRSGLRVGRVRVGATYRSKVSASSALKDRGRSSVQRAHRSCRRYPAALGAHCGGPVTPIAQAKVNPNVERSEAPPAGALVVDLKSTRGFLCPASKRATSARAGWLKSSSMMPSCVSDNRSLLKGYSAGDGHGRQRKRECTASAAPQCAGQQGLKKMPGPPT